MAGCWVTAAGAATYSATCTPGYYNSEQGEVDAKTNDVVGMEEYFHPRLEEAMGLLPAGWADWLDRSPRLKA